jgi:DNA-binding NarL/FixJ family response regulator
MQTTRVLLVEMPHMLRDIVKTIVEREGDMEVVGDLGDQKRVIATALDRRADFVIAGLESGELPEVFEELVSLDPEVEVLAVARDGRHSFLYKLEPQLKELGELSPELLLETIRSAGQRRRREPRSPAASQRADSRTQR